MNDIKIREIIIECLKKIVGEDSVYNLDNIDNDTSLLSIGVNSLNVIKIIILLEEDFNISFEDEDIAMKNWKDINSIISVIKRRMNK